MQTLEVNMKKIRTMRISEFCTTGSGGTPSRSQPERYYLDGSIPWVKSGELNDGIVASSDEHITDVALAETSVKLVPKGAILVAMYGATVGRTALLGIEATTNQAVCFLVPDERKVRTRYLWYFLRYNLPVFLAKRVGGAQPNISQQIIKETAVPVPSLERQDQIIAWLDKADSFKSRQHASYALASKLRAAYFHELFGGDDAAGPKWPIESLGKFISDARNGMSRRRKQEENAGTIVLRIRDVSAGRIDLSEPNRIDLSSEEQTAYSLKNEDVLLVRVNGSPDLVGVATKFLSSTVNEPVAFNDHIIRVRLNKEFITPDYLVHFLSTPEGRRQIQSRISTTAGQFTINRTGISSIEIPVPPVPLQTRFAESTARIQDFCKKQHELESRANDLFQALLRTSFENTTYWNCTREMLTSITLSNFKSIRDPLSIELKPITLLFGPNSAGKSSMVQAVHYAREILERSNFNADRTIYGADVVDLGGFRNLVHGRDTSLPLSMRFDLDLANVDVSELVADLGVTTSSWTVAPQIRNCWLRWTIQWSDYIEAPSATEFEVGINGERLIVIDAPAEQSRVSISELNLRHALFIGDEQSGSGLELMLADICDQCKVDSPDLELSLQKTAIPNLTVLFDLRQPWMDSASNLSALDTINVLLTQCILGPLIALRNNLRQFRYLGPLRDIPPRNYIPSLTKDESKWACGLAAWDTLFGNGRSFVDAVSIWLSEEDRLNTGYALRIHKYKEIDTESPLYIALTREDWFDDSMSWSQSIAKLPEKKKLVVVEQKTGLELLPQDLGTGISQVVPVVVAVLDAAANFIAIEQPELHVHPSIQTALGDVFIEEVERRAEVCFLLETHSEHLLLRLLRRVREVHEGSLAPGVIGLTPEKLSVIYMESSADGTKAHKLRVDATGDFIDRWPKGFFAEREEELFGCSLNLP